MYALMKEECVRAMCYNCVKHGFSQLFCGITQGLIFAKTNQRKNATIFRVQFEYSKHGGSWLPCVCT